MKAFIFIFDLMAGAALLAGCGGGNSPSETSSPNPADVNNPLVNAKRTADKTVNTTALNQAIQLFNVQEGRYPKDLQELVPKYVAFIPNPPAGCKISYDATKGEVSVVRQ